VAWRAILLCALTIWMTASSAAAQTARPTEEADHAVVYELGWAGAWSHDDGCQPKGVTAAFEKTPIEGVLEFEAGITVLRSRAATETSLDLLFKKPWTLSPRAEFMAGIGPELVHESVEGTFWGLSAVADFMFWPKRNVGWYLEPGYEIDFAHDGTRHGFAIAAGLLIGR
jgi:hypothetical protein